MKNEQEGRKSAPWKITNLNDAKRPGEKTNPVRQDKNTPSINNIRMEQPNNNGGGNTNTGRGWPEYPVNVKPSENRQERQPVNVVPQNWNNTKAAQPRAEKPATVRKQERQEKAKESKPEEKSENKNPRR